MRSPESTLDDGNAEAGPSTPRLSTQERARHAQYEEEERTRAAEVARMQTVNFLSKLTKEGRASEYRRKETDELVEKCYFSCTQSYAVVQDKRVRREPDCTAWCYLRIKDKGKQVKSDMLKSKEPLLYPRPPKEPEDDDSRYRFRFLADRYFFKAKGRMAIAKHAEEDIDAKSIYDLEEIQANTPPPMVSRAEKLGLVTRQRMAPIPSYEVICPLGTAVATRLHRFEKHLIRIYGPTYNALKRMPGLYADGTVQKTGWQLYESVINGDGLVLGQRLLGVAQDTYKKLKESANREGGNGMPPLFPRPPSGNGGPPGPDTPGTGGTSSGSGDSSNA